MMGRSCLGRLFRENGQSRVPRPPAMITAYSIGQSVGSLKAGHGDYSRAINGVNGGEQKSRKGSIASKMGRMRQCDSFWVLLLVLLIGGCSTVNRDYEQAAANSVTAGRIEGAWDGRWQSEGGHGGDHLRAILLRTSADTIHARFRARF